jgi:hypothetical protein
MYLRQQEIYANVRKQDCDKTYDCKDCRPPAPPVQRVAGMQIGKKYQPGDE